MAGGSRAGSNHQPPRCWGRDSPLLSLPAGLGLSGPLQGLPAPSWSPQGTFLGIVMLLLASAPGVEAASLPLSFSGSRPARCGPGC